MQAAPSQKRPRPAFPQALLDHVIAHYKQPSDLIGENGMLKQLTKAVFEAALKAEMAQHLSHAQPTPPMRLRVSISACVN